MNLTTRLGNIERRLDLLEGRNENNFSIMFKDRNGLYYDYQLIDRERVKVHLTQEKLDDFHKSHSGPVIILDDSLDAEGTKDLRE